jgi:hypothetical protein
MQTVPGHDFEDDKMADELEPLGAVAELEGAIPATRRPPSRRFLIVLAVGVLAAAAISVAILGWPPGRATDHHHSVRPAASLIGTRLASDDGAFSLTVPIGWQRASMITATGVEVAGISRGAGRTVPTPILVAQGPAVGEVNLLLDIGKYANYRPDLSQSSRRQQVADINRVKSVRASSDYRIIAGHDAFVVYVLHADGARATEVLTAIAAGADTYIVRLAGVSFDEADQILASITIA